MRKSMPPMEASLWNALRGLKQFGRHFRRQIPFAGGRYFCDFACLRAKLIVEVDGETHTLQRYDADRDAFMRAEGYRVLRVTNDEVRTNRDGVVAEIVRLLGDASAQAYASPSPGGGGIKGGVGPQTQSSEESP